MMKQMKVRLQDGREVDVPDHASPREEDALMMLVEGVLIPGGLALVPAVDPQDGKPMALLARATAGGVVPIARIIGAEEAARIRIVQPDGTLSEPGRRDPEAIQRGRMADLAAEIAAMQGRGQSGASN